MSVPMIETDRLILREFRESDFPVYERLAADIEVMRYLGGKTMNQVEAWRHMAFMVGHWTLRSYGYFAVEEKATEEFIGRVGFTNPTGWPGFELGWTIAPWKQGKGFASEAARRLLDYAFCELDREHVISLIHPDNSPSRRVAEKLGETLEGETEVLGMPVLIYGIDRTPAGTGDRLTGSRGQIVVMRTAAISVGKSEQLTAERMLRMHGFVLDNLREGVSVSDESGVIVYTNAAEDRLFGYAAGELVGQHVTVQNAYSREENDQIVRDVIDQLQNHGVWEGEWQNIRKDRTRFSSYARITTFATDGRKYWVCVQEDTSESKRSNERKEFLDGVATVLQGSFAEQPTLANFARYCLPFLGDYCSVDLLTANGEVRRVETAHRDPLKEPLVRNLWTRYPYDAADPVGAPKALYTGEPQFHPQILEGAIEALARDAEHLKLLRDMNPCSYICVPLTARGHIFGALSLVMSDSGRTYTEDDLATAVELARRAAVTVDNARLYAAEHEARQAADQARQRAEEANRMKSQFVATMSHELRTPLNAIAGHVQLLDMQLYGPLTEAQREALARVARAQHYLLGLINDVLNFARLEAGKVEYDLHPVLLQEVVGDIMPMVEPQFGAKKLDLAVVLPAASPASNEGMAGAVFAWADSEKLRQILLNVLSNAAKFTPAGGRVTLRLSADAEAAIVAITDTGVGVPGDKLDAIFEPFVQLNATYNRHAEGTGLGLAISRDLARGMGGELTCSSREREGSTFTLTLRRATG